jgi:hypothetical protein
MPILESSSQRLDPELYARIECGSIVYVCNSALRFFRDTILPTISVPFVLVSGDSDNEMPFDIFSQPDFESFIQDSRIFHWFCQNLMISHPKMTRMPIGLDYHTMSNVGARHPWGEGKSPVDQEKELDQAIADAPPLNERHVYCYSNFHHTTFGIGSRGDRQEAIAKIPKELVFYDPVFTPRDVAWNHQSFFQFVLSPRGGGYDCHRTWEALLLGCIPVLKSSGLDPLFEGLPVLILKDWSDLTRELMNQTALQLSQASFQKEKLLLSYWTNLFHLKSQECRQTASANTLQ